MLLQWANLTPSPILLREIIMNLPALNTLLCYQHPHVLNAYTKRYPHHTLSAERAFQEVLKYLWLTRKLDIDLKENPHSSQLPREIGVFRSMTEIDDMWHEFILFTQNYTDFCIEYFGEYLHHQPTVIEDNESDSEEEILDDLPNLLSYVYDNLGEETLRTWFGSYLK
jgi:hypothetical protein